MNHKTSPIQILVNYWEIKPAALKAKVQGLAEAGVQEITAFVPWQAVEADVSHQLSRFLSAVHEAGLQISLVLTPEVGVHFANSGLPKDLAAQTEVAAKDARGESISLFVPPNAFSLPSLLSQEFQKRYHNFLTRMDSLLADLERLNPGILKRVTLTMTGSFWKYYRSPLQSSGRPFQGRAGDYSTQASLQFRARMEQFAASKELIEDGIAEAQRWKTRPLEEVNRKWFYQQSEDVFRTRSAQFLRKRAPQVGLESLELLTPEADPGFQYSAFLQWVSGASANFYRLAELLDSFSARVSTSHTTDESESRAAKPAVHWTGLGIFRSLSDSEKQFLIMKSLLLTASQGGKVLIDEGEWFSLSHSFRKRVLTMSGELESGKLYRKTELMYITPHLWSESTPIWSVLEKKLPQFSRITASVDLAVKESAASSPKVIWVDPELVITKERLDSLLRWTSSTGRMVVLPRTSLYTSGARKMLEKELEDTGDHASSMHIELGLSYEIKVKGSGRLVVYNWKQAESREDIETFATSLLSVAGIEFRSNLSDSRLESILLQRKHGSGLGLFVLNDQSRPIAADLLFGDEILLSDLARELSGGAPSPETDASVLGSRFSIEVPPHGILPVAVREPKAEIVEPISPAHSPHSVTGEAAVWN